MNFSGVMKRSKRSILHMLHFVIITVLVLTGSVITRSSNKKPSKQFFYLKMAFLLENLNEIN